MKIAILSDIHGNFWALDAVLRDLEVREPDLIVNLGDSLYGPLDPMGTFDIIRSLPIVSIAGNEDRLILERNHESPTLEFVMNELNAKAMDWLSSLPSTLTVMSSFFLCHGTPLSDTTYLLENVQGKNISARDPKEVESLLAGVTAKLVLCGHSHLPRIVQAGGKLVVNPGSVGCPAFDDDHPNLHMVENHSPHARYALLDYAEGMKGIEHVIVPYDHEKAARQAEKNQRPDWAKWLRTGRV